jgi:CRISPR-associated exonuclease Cas4
MPTLDQLVLILLLVAVALGAYGAYRLKQLWGEQSLGRLVSVDTGPGSGPTLRSPRWRIAGRPDEIQELRDGRWVPVEWKTRSAPRGGPLPSHRVQLLAYCLLCEEAKGSAPPYGILRYGDGIEFKVPWDASARSELWRLRSEMARRYDGRASPSPGKCAGCRWRDGCDARAV